MIAILSVAAELASESRAGVAGGHAAPRCARSDVVREWQHQSYEQCSTITIISLTLRLQADSQSTEQHIWGWHCQFNFKIVLLLSTEM